MNENRRTPAIGMHVDNINLKAEAEDTFSWLLIKTSYSASICDIFKEMESRAAERNFLSVFFGDVAELETHAPTQQIPNSSFKTASRLLHTGYIRPHHVLGVAAKSSKDQKKTDEDFWNSKDGSLSPLPDVEGFQNTASKSAKHQDIVSANFRVSDEFGIQKNKPDFDTGSIESILNRVRPGIKLNRVQILVRDCIFNSDESAVVGAPTGKTLRAQKLYYSEVAF